MSLTRSTLRPLFLAALVVCSALTGAVAFTESANADEITNGEVVFAGETITFDTGSTSASPGDTLRLVRDPGTDEATTIEQVSVNGSGIAEVDTGDLETNDYALFDGQTELVRFEVIVQSLDASFTADQVVGTGTLEFTSNRVEPFNVTVEADGLSRNDLLDAFADADAFENGDGDVEFTTTDEATVDVDFTDIDGGDYTLTFATVDSTASATVDVSVGNTDAAELSFAESVRSVESGDTTTITVEFEETTRGYLRIGSGDLGYENVWLVEDLDEDGEATLRVNTFAVETSPYGLSAVDASAASVEWDGSLSSGSAVPPLDPGRYDMAATAFAGDIDDSPDAIGRLDVTERNSGDAATWVGPGEGVEDLEDGDDVVEAVNDGTLTERREVARGDYAVLRFRASGVFGYLAVNEDDYADAFGPVGTENPDAPLSLRVQQSDPGPNREATVIPNDDLTYVLDDERNVLFVAVPTTGLSGVTVEAGDRFNATLEVNAGSELNAGSRDERLSTGFRVVDREASLRTNAAGTVELDAVTNAPVRGTTTAAPGSVIQITVRSASGTENPFVLSEQATVGPDGRFEASFDLADLTAGTNLTVTVGGGPGFDGQTTFDGVVVTQTETPPSTTDPTETTPTDDGTATPTPTPADGGTPTATEETTTTTPGFGVAVAVVALLVAALFRRG